MRFQSEDQRKAVFARLREGTVARAKTFWARRNPFTYVEGVAPVRKAPRTAAKPITHTPYEVRERQRLSADILRDAGFRIRTAALTKQGRLRLSAERKQALRQAALIGLGTAAVGLPAGYFLLRTNVGRRLAAKGLRKFRPFRAARGFTKFAERRAVGGVDELVRQGERTARRVASTAIDRFTARLTGIHDIPEELLKQEGRLRGQLFRFQTEAERVRALRSVGAPVGYARGQRELNIMKRELGDVQEALGKYRGNAYTGPGWIDRADVVFKRTVARVAGRFGIPVVGPATRSVRARVAAEVGERKLQNQLLWERMRKRGRASTGGVSLTKLKSGAIRRRGRPVVREQEWVWFPVQAQTRPATVYLRVGQGQTSRAPIAIKAHITFRGNEPVLSKATLRQLYPTSSAEEAAKHYAADLKRGRVHVVPTKRGSSYRTEDVGASLATGSPLAGQAPQVNPAGGIPVLPKVKRRSR